MQCRTPSVSTQFLLSQYDQNNRLTVRLLESGTGTLSAKLLGLAPTGIGDEKAAVELNEGGLQEVLGVLVNVLGVVGDL